ncbi:antimicrobial peptides [Brachypodium distachyon]|uniref:Plant antimicrobial peptide domain-containing protein n=1 Tax=Brachypodium distachyon TaxID=15368 RepID=A0A0Q3H3U0_BRADI|nr:antimicrobial peptides [Brachypodium distachyon]KQJ88090.1 hypothetical protein BRADI_4g15295v3 [Brachypodium distachyon]|eukprot:XP_010237613.1 antimicrobial peptides [Brachypodium distachyon]
MGVGNGNKGGVAVVWWCLLILAGLLFLAVAAASTEAEAESGGRGIVNTKEDRRWCKKDCEWKKQQCLHSCKQQQQQQKAGGDAPTPNELDNRECEHEHCERYQDPKERERCWYQCFPPYPDVAADDEEEEEHHGGQGHGGGGRCQKECKQRYGYGDERQQQCLRDCEEGPGGGGKHGGRGGAGGRGREGDEAAHDEWGTEAV